MRLFIFAMCIAIVSPQLFGAESCPHKQHYKPTKAELSTILTNHMKWVDKNAHKIFEFKLSAEDRKDPLRANLCNASLRFANLAYATLLGADLANADLWGANLNHAKLYDADLSNVDLFGADLSNADLRSAKLNGANLWDVDLTNAGLMHANLTGTVWTTKSNALPALSTLVGNPTLGKITYTYLPPLIELRKALDANGYDTTAKQITQVVRHVENQQRLASHEVFKFINGVFNLVFFEWPTDWGVAPGRALMSLLFGIVVFMFFYLVALQAPEKTNGVWLLRGKERILDTDKADKELVQPNGFWHAVIIAFYFSLLSAFNLGWRDLNVGSWINRLQRKENTYRATGWVRTVAGIQSLMSVYLVAMWALTYFGRPFG